MCDSSLRCCLWHVLRQHALSAYACSHALLHCAMCLHAMPRHRHTTLDCCIARCHVCLFLLTAYRHVRALLPCDWSLVSAIRQFRRVAKRFDDNVTMLCLAVPCIGTFSSVSQSILLTVVSSHHGDAERVCADCRRCRRFSHCADFRHGERVCADCRR